MRLKFLLIGLLLGLLASSSAFAQCTGNPAAGRICANVGATPTLPAWATMTSALDRNFGGPSPEGAILNRGASVWDATRTPSLGLNGTAGGTITLRGATSGGATISVAAAAGTTTFRLPVGNGTLNQVLVTDGAGNTSWTTAGAGTVSSVGLSMPAIFNVSGSPVTGVGTLTATLANQTANTVFGGPTSGGAAAPAFRALVGADLPNPSASTLGGVQSFSAVSSQWIRQISTSGVPTASQPAFSDISGTLAPSQCPNPSAVTIGCVQSLAAVTSRWLNSISTSGVPTATQPNFTDIAGNATLSQLPSISNLSVLGNASGGTSVPQALTATQVLDFIGSTRGQVLYRGASGWAALAVGSSGQVLTTSGVGADPVWATVSGTGTVTNVATGVGLTGGPITTTGTIEFATIANQRILANVSGGAAAPTANTLSSILDIAGSTTGNVLYRSGGGWTVLAPGSNGQVLTMGASTPAWGAAGSVTNVTISAGTGVGTSGTCNISTTGTCTIANSGVLSVGGQTGALSVGTGVSMSGSTIGLSLTNATLQGSPSNPTNTSSTTAVMAGFGVSTCRITPSYSGRLNVTFYGEWTANADGIQVTLDMRYGTGAGPGVNTPASGTQIAGPISQGIPFNSYKSTFSLSSIITGLTPGVAVWLDLSRFTITNTLIMSNVKCVAFEF